jgi:GNAT superfamily N-acetyltransferase
MPFHLNKLDKTINALGESDIYLLPPLASLQLRSWLSSPLYRYIYPGPPSTHPSISSNMLGRHKHALLESPTCHIISLIHSSDPEVGEPWVPVGFVKYHLFKSQSDVEKRVDAGARTWPEGTNVAMVEWVWSRIKDSRLRYGAKLGAHVDVEILAVDPGFQRQGAGRMLMDAVLREADEAGLQMYLEGSEEGRVLYERLGFVTQEVIWVDLPRWENGGDKGEGWEAGRTEGKGEGWYCQRIMLRAAKKE